MKVDLIQSDCLAAHHARWRVVHELFERLRHAPRNVWHAELNAVAPGDPAWDVTMRHMGNALATVTLTLSPRRIVLGGSVRRAGRLGRRY